MTLFAKVNTASVRFEAQVPWASAAAPRPPLGEMLHATPRLQLETRAQESASFKVASHTAPAPPSAAPRSVLKASAPVNDPWRRTPVGNGEFISMAGPNGTDTPQWKNAFISRPVGFFDYARGYASEMVGGTFDLAKTVLNHVHDTALTLVQRGEILPAFPTPPKLLYDVGTLFKEAFGAPLRNAMTDVIEQPNHALNNAGDAIASFFNDYKNSLGESYHTVESSGALGASTYLLLSMGAADALKKMLNNVGIANAQMKKIIRDAPQATSSSIAQKINISPLAGDPTLHIYAYQPQLMFHGRAVKQPYIYPGASPNFEQHGFQATYDLRNKFLSIDINTELRGTLELNAALGDSHMMTSVLMNTMRIDGAPVKTIALRPNELQIPPAGVAERDWLISKEIDQIGAVRALKERGYVVKHLDVALPGHHYIVLRKAD